MASTGVKVCPKCEYEYLNTSRLPDICYNCQEDINEKPMSDFFAVPDYLFFQLQDRLSECVESAKPMASTLDEYSKPMSVAEVTEALSSNAYVELGIFLRTCSFATVKSALADANLFMKYLLQNHKIKKDQMLHICKEAEAIGRMGKMLTEIISAGAVVLYDERSNAAKAAKLREFDGNPLDTNEEGDKC